MQRARVIGNVVATTKHFTMVGHRLLVMQPLGPSGRADGEPFLVVDALGASVGSIALITSDGHAARNMVGTKATPVRYVTIGLEDDR